MKKTRRHKSENSKRLTSETMKKRWAERKRLAAVIEEEKRRIAQADYNRRRTEGLLTAEELELERKYQKHRQELLKRRARDCERRGMLALIEEKLIAGESISHQRAFALAARYLQKMHLTQREERCIVNYLTKWKGPCS